MIFSGMGRSTAIFLSVVKYLKCFRNGLLKFVRKHRCAKKNLTFYRQIQISENCVSLIKSNKVALKRGTLWDREPRAWEINKFNSVGHPINKTGTSWPL